jgi:hypothetical protein
LSQSNKRTFNGNSKGGIQVSTNTYTALRTTTVGTAVSSVTLDLTGITGYTDLVIAMNIGTSGTGTSTVIQFNNDTSGSSTNYSFTDLYGDGSVAGSARQSNASSSYLSYYIGAIPAIETMLITQIINYSNTTTYKTFITRNGRASSGSYPGTEAIVGLWRQTAAINSIKLSTTSGTFGTGSTFTIYGVAAWAPESTPKATGGYVTSDSTYYYHTFTSSGNFITNQTLSCEALVIAGGGSGGAGVITSGGGGAGGLITSSNSYTNAANYTVTVGAGAAGASLMGLTGNNSSISGTAVSLTANGGGAGAGSNNPGPANGGNGGSGGGASAANNTDGAIGTGGTGSQGGNGGRAWASSVSVSVQGSGGGGGAGGNGESASSGVTGAGGVGTSAYTDWLSTTGIGQNVSGTYWVGGGGGAGSRGASGGAGGTGGGGLGGLTTTSRNGAPGASATGGGGGGNYGDIGGAGGSGLVIIRYLKA